MPASKNVKKCSLCGETKEASSVGGKKEQVQGKKN